MRASRLVSLLLLLQARGRLTACELAEALEVSERTIYRDLFELGAAGVPVYGERGKGGGYRLLDGYRTNLTGLTAEEAGALLMSGAPGPAAELGLGSLLAATRLKLLAAVPTALRETATRAEGRFYLDPGGWAHDRARDDRHLKTVARAVWNDGRLEIGYRRPDGQAARRTLDPLGLVHKTGVWYLVAIHDGATRVYRVDRILAAQETETASRGRLRSDDVLAKLGSRVRRELAGLFHPRPARPAGSAAPGRSRGALTPGGCGGSTR
jgi:predicted DNA-binding transcriptional regulator YafY